MKEEMYLYIADDIGYQIFVLIHQVLEDSETDPHYSAVTALNLFKCYNQILEDFDKSSCFENIKDFMLQNRFEEGDYEKFEILRKKESEYYKGPQF